MSLSLIGYNQSGAWQENADTIDELQVLRTKADHLWINLNQSSDAALVRAMSEVYHIHPLTVEDILDNTQRPKAEEFDDYLFLILKMVSRKGEAAPEFEQISMILTGDTLITVQESEGDPFNGIRQRILNNGGRFRRMGIDYLAYAIIDCLIEGYFLTLDSFSLEFEAFEERAFDENDSAFIPDIQKTRRNISSMRRIIWPMRESIAALIHFDSELLHKELEPFFKDILDNIVQISEIVENYRELLSGIMEVNLSAISNRMNRVMKVLTIISTIFIPLTFIVGVYGMNFAYMPELQNRFAYPLVWAVMLIIALAMVLFFKKNKWL
ncbi:MAG: magnesium/cobalt transporter CorA [Spirochaetaceae bacterium]|jgi:magnesium transporter|nr:magnesium/cobalt transporter CorA [Spirochaetaceae bacterium]